MKLPHVSKALKELEGAEFVRCLTPGRRKGRIYSLTREGESVSSHVWLRARIGYYGLLKLEVGAVLDEAGIPHTRNIPLRGERFEVWPDFVIPSSTAPKVIVEAKSFASISPETMERIRGSALTVADLKGKIKCVKAVLVVGGISRKDLPEISGLTSPEHFDAMFFEGSWGTSPGT
jgi:hypothetical protein